MIAVDSNLLVYSVRRDSPFHAGTRSVVRNLAESGRPWAIAWPSIHEFPAVITHPKIYRPPTPLVDAILQVDYWMESPTLQLLGEQANYWEHLRSMLTMSKVGGPMVHDARIAAICRTHGVTELLTADRDYSRFPGLLLRNPLI